MMRYLKDGFKTTTSQSFLILVLWLYHFAWGFALLLFVKSVVLPLMHRYPGGHLPPGVSQLFLAEGQFRLMKTDLSHSYLWALLGFAAARMLLTPLLNAGVYYSLHHRHLNSGYRFLQGVRLLSGPFFGYYVAQMALTLAPLYWLYPIAVKAFTHETDYTSLALALLPWAAGYAVYVFALRLLFVYIQLGRTAEGTIGGSLWLFVRKLPVIVGLAVALLALSGAATAAALAASLVWAGVSALLLHQLFHIVNMLFKLWTIASQYHVYEREAA
ncbi:hypothetical protein [Paenibacillus flagellatus]|uniref:DUF975 domain-containing protein n=1 Tax=Paenibacillus flagellatus TaxID=2211139 RepID=A0A2V5K4N1_9BACL|nr:hypothetical protein [Paenibacillus flagellatus]PYI52673.1 hypothetical protein DLM86_21135 [Paenibacillus flagellatus]